MFQFEPKETIPITRQIDDPADTDTYYVRAYVRDAKTDELLNTVDLTDMTDQRFVGTVEAPHDPTGNGRYISITTKVFTDAAYTTESPMKAREMFVYLVQARWKFPFGGGGGSDVSYEKIRKVVQEELEKIPRAEPAKPVDLSPVLKAIDRVKRIVELFEIPDMPKFPEIKMDKVDLSPVILAVDNLRKEVSRLENADFTDVKDELSGLTKAVEDLFNKNLKQDIVFKLLAEKDEGAKEEPKPEYQPINFKDYFKSKK